MRGSESKEKNLSLQNKNDALPENRVNSEWSRKGENLDCLTCKRHEPMCQNVHYVCKIHFKFINE